MEKPKELTREELEKKIIEVAAKYIMNQKPAPRKYDDVFFTNFKDLLA